MPPRWIQELMSIAAMVTGVIVTAFLMRKMPKRFPLATSPRQTRREAWLVLSFSFLTCAIAVWMMWGSRLTEHRIAVGISLAGIFLCGIAALYHWLHAPSAQDTLKNFAADAGHCGRCEYDLTGNVSGVCPECGWIIPRGPLDIDTPGWALWWRRWKIDHLRHWRNTLATVTVFALLFVTMAVLLAMYSRPLASALFPALMALHWAINAVRVAAYGRELRASFRA